MTESRTDKLTLVAFMQASNVSVFSGSWRYPSSAADYLDLRYLPAHRPHSEDGKFDLMFFDDRLAMPAIYGNSPMRRSCAVPAPSSSTSRPSSARWPPPPTTSGWVPPTPPPTTSRSTWRAPSRPRPPQPRPRRLERRHLRQ